MPTTLLDVECMWEVPSFYSGMADVGTCYTIDAQRHVRSFTTFTGMVNPGAHNNIDAQRHVGGLTVWELMAPTIQ